MISFKQTISITEVFHFKNPRPGFSFSPPVSSEITQCRFFWPDFHLSSYRLIVQALKSDYSSLKLIRNHSRKLTNCFQHRCSPQPKSIHNPPHFTIVQKVI